jgi:hypothetical protein
VSERIVGMAVVSLLEEASGDKYLDRKIVRRK